ncbi:GLPGLI family protein [Prevotella sp. HUN102]|uniref:GLPGLI family protein n=1 Tax=Prevotella sp. HUN102 TaxID=1392486 RepID=UPI0009DFF67F|nr:GLPGLI family protein [Prevotella sp. HUN102]
MKQILMLLLLSVCCNVAAQKKLDDAKLECQYNYVYQNDTLKGSTKDDRLVLLIGAKVSKCYSYYSMQMDTTFSKPNWFEIVSAGINQALTSNVDPPHKRMKTYVYKNYPEKQMTVTDGLTEQDYIYTDSLNNIEWTISDSTKTILNYTVQMATCDYRGHHWTAWFALDVPVSDGPWKLHGLPGLIMEAYDTKAYHHFTLVGIRKVKDMPIVMSKTYVGTNKFEKTNRKSFLKMQRQYLENMTGMIKLETGIDLDPNSSHKILTFQPLETE